MYRNTKVLILGGGVSGASCAISLQKEGFDVTIVERCKSIRNLPGETVHPGIQTLLSKLNVLDAIAGHNFKRNIGIDVLNQEGVTTNHLYNDDRSWKGFQLIRGVFDASLLEKCEQLGVNVLKGERPEKITMKTNGAIQSVVTNNHEYSADVFIDATGRSAWLARMLKKKYLKASKRLIAYYGTVEDHTLFENPRLIWNKKSWTWLSQINSSTICWTYLQEDDSVRFKKSWVPTQLIKSRIKTSRKATDVTWRIAENVADSNYFLLGDSAFILDPISGNGIIKAMMSGMMLAYQLKHSNNLESARKKYKNWIAEWFTKDSRQLYKLYHENGWDLGITSDLYKSTT